MSKTSTLTIGALAQAAGVGVETVRFYERTGLLPEPLRTPAGYRQYPRDTVDRVKFIRRGQGLGFALREIRNCSICGWMRSPRVVRSRRRRERN